MDPDDFTRCLDVVSGLTVFAHEFLLKLNRELEHFDAFASWLRHTLDELATVINIDDKPPEDPQIDTLRVSEYISEYLKESSLRSFFRSVKGPKISEYKGKGESIFELYARPKASDTKPPGFFELTEYLEDLCKTVFAKPQQAMRQQLRVGKPVVISDHNKGMGDMRMVTEEGRPVGYLAFRGGDGNDLILIRCDISIVGGLSSVLKTRCARVSLAAQERKGNLIDFQFVDDETIILLFVGRGIWPILIPALKFSMLG